MKNWKFLAILRAGARAGSKFAILELPGAIFRAGPKNGDAGNFRTRCEEDRRAFKTLPSSQRALEDLNMFPATPLDDQGRLGKARLTKDTHERTKAEHCTATHAIAKPSIAKQSIGQQNTAKRSTAKKNITEKHNIAKQSIAHLGLRIPVPEN